MAKVEIEVRYAKIMSEQLDQLGPLLIERGVETGNFMTGLMQAQSVAAGVNLMNAAIKAAEAAGPDGVGVFGACSLCGEIHGAEPNVIDVEEDSPLAS